MIKYAQTLKERRESEAGFGLVETMVALAVITIILIASFRPWVTAIQTDAEYKQSLDNNTAFWNSYQLLGNDRATSQNFSALPTGGDAVEFYGWDYSYVRWQFVTDEDGQTLLTREESPTANERNYGEPVVKARNLSDGQFLSVGDELHMTVGNQLIVMDSPRTHIPVGVVITQERANAEHLLQQDVQRAITKEGSTENLLVLELEDGSFVSWMFNGTRLERSTAPDLEAPYVDTRVMMTGLSGAHFSYDHYATRDITLVADGHETLFTIPLRAPN